MDKAFAQFRATVNSLALTEGAVKAAMEDWFERLPKAAVQEIHKYRKYAARGTAGKPVVDEIADILKKHKVQPGFFGSLKKAAQYIKDYGYDIFMVSMFDLGEAKMVKVQLNPKKKIGYKITGVGPGGKRTVLKSQDYPEAKPVKEESTPAWQRKEGKNPEGGLNKAGVASYRRANPGSKLQTAVTTKPSKLKPGSKSAKRRKSFCSRMKGMKAKLTSAKTARDPDSRINKSLRKWNC
jgi:hypothetical protein